jgi:hypothetical protein
MARSYAELLSDDPAWPELAKRAADAPNGAVVLPPPSDEHRRGCLEILQVSTRSTLGAICHETGGILVDHGFVRLLGSGSARLPRRLCDWNAELGIDLDRFMILADDVVGGVYAMDGKELGDVPGRVHYFSPDSLEWEDTELGVTDFVGWVLEGDLESFYATMRWKGWEKEIAGLPGDHALSVVPPMWMDGKKPIAKRDRRAVPAKELWSLMLTAARPSAR